MSVPGGLIHHWVGGAFIPRTTLQRTLEVSRAYDAYSTIYKEVIASKLNGNGSAIRTRPLCPYPQVAVYKGSGSTDEAANFSCQIPPR